MKGTLVVPQEQLAERMSPQRCEIFLVERQPFTGLD
jgi:hypothetical protein